MKSFLYVEFSCFKFLADLEHVNLTLFPTSWEAGLYWLVTLSPWLLIQLYFPRLRDKLSPESWFHSVCFKVCFKVEFTYPLVN